MTSRALLPVELLALGCASSLFAACGSSAESFSRSSGRSADAGLALDAEAPPVASTLRTRQAPAPSVDPSDEEDTLELFNDPGCPEVAEPLVANNCDPFDSAGTCPVEGWGCYPYVDYPSSPCEPELFGSVCEPAGPGLQGDDCRREGCAGGFLCVASGQGTQCAQLCALPGPNTCAAGLICGSVDIQGYGVCF